MSETAFVAVSAALFAITAGLFWATTHYWHTHKRASGVAAGVLLTLAIVAVAIAVAHFGGAS